MTLEILYGASVLLCRRPRLETARAIASLRPGFAVSGAVSAVYAVKVVIVAPDNPLALEQNLKNSACGAVAVGLDYRSFPLGMSRDGARCDGTGTRRIKSPG